MLPCGINPPPPPVNTPPAFIAPTPTCGSTIEAKVGHETSFIIQASDADAGDAATISVMDLPPGATLFPALPTDSTGFSWTPDANGTVTITFTATDNSNATAECKITLNVTTCPEGQGHWRNNPDLWPVASLLLGTNSYTQAQLIAILDLPVGNGNKANASLLLCRQLIPAKLSIAAGTVAPQAVLDAIAAADALIGSNLIPMNVKVNTPLGQQMVALKSLLEDFNMGYDSPGCIIGSQNMALIPEVGSGGFSLEQNVPNPFSTTTLIRYTLPDNGATWNVTLVVLDMQGREVATLLNEQRPEGTSTVLFDGAALPQGAYFYRLTANDRTGYKKMMVVR